MEQKIAICLGTDRRNNVRVRLSLMLINGEHVVVEHFHSASIEPNHDLDSVRANLESHIAMPQSATGIPLAPWPSIPDEEWEKVELVCAAVQPRN